jgi:hypothetical protein
MTTQTLRKDDGHAKHNSQTTPVERAAIRTAPELSDNDSRNAFICHLAHQEFKLAHRPWNADPAPDYRTATARPLFKLTLDGGKLFMAKSPFCTKLCGIDPRTGQPYYLSNPADAITQRISMMLQYLNTHGYNQNGTNWGNYLSGTTPLWQNTVLAGHSQGGVMSTFAAYENMVARAINLSAPPQATLVNGVEVGATYFTNTPATNIQRHLWPRQRL